MVYNTYSTRNVQQAVTAKTVAAADTAKTKEEKIIEQAAKVEETKPKTTRRAKK